MLQLSHLSALQVSQIVRYGTFVLIGVGLVKLGISPGEIGIFETFLMLSGMLTFFWVSGIVNTMLSSYGKANELNKKSLIFNAFIALCIFSILASISLVTFTGVVFQFLSKPIENELILLSAIYILFNGPTFILEYTLWLNNKREALLYYSLIQSFLTVAAVLIPTGFNLGLNVALLCLIALSVVKLIVSVVVISRFSTINWNPAAIRSTMLNSLPLVLSILLSGSAEYIDSLIVKARFDNVYFAIFRYGAKELPILLIVANTFSSSMIPALAGNLHSGLGDLKQKSTRLMHVFFPISILLMLLSPWLYIQVFSESFIYSSLIFNIYLLLIIPRLVFPQTILTATGHNKYLLFSSVLEITINVALSIYLSGIFGLPGIAIGTLVAFTVDKVFLIHVVRHKIGISVTDFVDLKPYFLYSSIILAAFAISLHFLQQGTFSL